MFSGHKFGTWLLKMAAFPFIKRMERRVKAYLRAFLLLLTGEPGPGCSQLLHLLHYTVMPTTRKWLNC